MKITQTITKSAKRVARPDVLAATAGFAATRLAERSVYGMAPGVFGENSTTYNPDTNENDVTQPNGSQRFARGAYLVGQAAAGGYMAMKTTPAVRGAGIGVAAGSVWHLANLLGINL